ncbi:hypothetical protein MSj_01073 [Microcystis aeruginosa Sj]|uniref:InsA N-terminal domain-containing protein n=1 Tax=Microcystis aeruginosa Sj TaxID=1979544 RepID=A0A2Z6UKH1_MICAE|nr:hypothetical protein MSj_01073 [Microcystis aeruginosa Sj]
MTFLRSISLWLVEGLLKYQPSTEQNPPTGLPVFTCPSCASHHTIKNPYIFKGKPKRHCQECGQPFVINPTNKTISPDTKIINRSTLARTNFLTRNCESKRGKLVMVTKLCQQWTGGCSPSNQGFGQTKRYIAHRMSSDVSFCFF